MSRMEDATDVVAVAVAVAVAVISGVDLNIAGAKWPPTRADVDGGTTMGLWRGGG